MKKIFLRRLKKLKVNQKREILKRCSKESEIAIPQLFSYSDEEIEAIFNLILGKYKDGD